MTTPDRTQLLAHYIIYRSTPDKLGATKLNKVMWFSDLEAYERFGQSISGQETYEKKQFGPVPNHINDCLRNLQKSGAVTFRANPTPAGDRHEYLWLKEPDISSFTAEEIDIINRSIEWVCDHHSAVTISKKTHDALWQETEGGEQIEIKAATIAAKPVTGRYLEWALQQDDGQI